MREKLDSNEASLAGAGLNACGAVSVSNEIEPLLVADLDFPAPTETSEFSQGMMSLEQPFGVTMLLSVAGNPVRAFKDPKGLDIRLQLTPGVNEL